MDCDDVTLMLAAGAQPTQLMSSELRDHVAGCAACRQLAETRDDQFRWIMRIPNDALDDPDLLVLATVDPIVFASAGQLARGGMGKITRARDRRLGRDVAIKEVLDPSLRGRFEREALITAKLQHPAIVPIYEAGMWPDGSAFYTMRLVAGGTLHDAIAATATLEDRLALLPHVRAVTDALAYAHSRRIVHRDLKPGNILVGEFGETVVIDWGLAKELDRGGAEPSGGDPAPGSSDLTRAGSVMGTPGFMSPEQAGGAAVDERGDVYALGAILYNVLAGHPPYADGGGPGDGITAARLRPPTPIGELAPGAPADLRAIVERAMARPAEARYPTAQPLAEELRRFEAGQLLRSREYGLRELVTRWVRRHRTAVIVAAIGLVVVVAVGVAAIAGIARSEARARVAQHGAEAARAAADADNAALLEEQGRSELVSGNRERALAYLSEAYRRGRDSVAIRHLVAAATRDPDLLDHAIDLGAASEITSIGFVADGGVVTVDTAAAGAVAIWEAATPRGSHSLALAPADPERRRWSRLSPDGRHALVADGPGLAMYDTGSGERLWTDGAGENFLGSVAFDPTGARVVVVVPGARDGLPATAELRDVATGAVLASLGGTLAAAGAAFSPDGQRVAVCGTDGNFGVWDVRTGRRVMAEHVAQRLLEVVFAGNDRIVVATFDRGAQIWRVGGPLIAHVGSTIYAIAASPRGDLVATSAIDVVQLWSPQGELLGEAHDPRGMVLSLAFSPDGTRLLGGGGADTQAYVWDTPFLALRGAVVASRGMFARVAWRGDGGRFATAGDARALVWRAPAGSEIARVPAAGFAVAGAQLVAATDSEVTVRRLDTGAVAARIAVAAPPRASSALAADDLVQVSRDGSRALVHGAGRTTIYDLTRAARAGELPSRPERWLVSALSRDGRRVLQYAGGGELAPLRVHDAGTGRVVRELALAEVADAALGPDGERLVVAFQHRAPRMWRVSTGDELALPVQAAYHDAVFDRSGRRLVLYGAPGPAVVIDVTTGATLATLATQVDDARFDDAGRRVATHERSTAVKLWDVATGAVLAAIDSGSSHAIALSGDGARLATVADSGSIRIWDGATARLLEVIASPPFTGRLEWSDDGTRLVAQLLGHEPLAIIRDVHLEQRPPAAVADLAAQLSGWRLDHGLLVPRPRSGP